MRGLQLAGGPVRAAVAAGLLCLAAGTASAGEWIIPKHPLVPLRPAELKVLQFKGAGSPQLVPRQKLPPAPLPLDAATRAKLLSGPWPPSPPPPPPPPGGSYVKLNATQAIVPDRGVLLFYCPFFVDPQSGGASFFNQNAAPMGSALGLCLRAAAGHKYLIDYSVSYPPLGNDTTNVTYLVQGPGNSNQTTDIKGPGHLVIVLDAQTDGWYQFNISGLGSGWSFSGCEVTLVK